MGPLSYSIGILVIIQRTLVTGSNTTLAMVGSIPGDAPCRAYAYAVGLLLAVLIWLCAVNRNEPKATSHIISCEVPFGGINCEPEGTCAGLDGCKDRINQLYNVITNRRHTGLVCINLWNPENVRMEPFGYPVSLNRYNQYFDHDVHAHVKVCEWNQVERKLEGCKEAGTCSGWDNCRRRIVDLGGVTSYVCLTEVLFQHC